jgi:vacuolar protein sorting-associated protein 13A/C
VLVLGSQRQKGDEYHVGMSWSEGQGKYKLSKVVTLTPRFFLKNNLSNAIVFREHGVAPRERAAIEPGQQCAFQTLRSGAEKLLTIALPGLNTQW